MLNVAKRICFVCAALLLCLSMVTNADEPIRSRFTVPANAPLTSTGLKVVMGQPLTVWAKGTYEVRPANKDRDAIQVRPRGTFHFESSVVGKPFPLPAAGTGPAACYCLIGRIGENGTPFYVGEKHSVVAQSTGELFLGINDFNLKDNRGELNVVVDVGDKVHTSAIRQRVAFDGPSGRPARGARVVVFYVDGLRPDIVREMSAMGHLPNITRIFLDGGSQLENSFTTFPANTITANGSLWTGMFSDRHGIKSQVGFNRRTKTSENYLGKFGPVLNDMLLQPKGLDRVLLNARSKFADITKGDGAGEALRRRKTSETPTLSTRLVSAGKTFSSGVMPLMSDISPSLWTRYLADEVPYFGTHLADRYVDEANTSYAIENLFENLTDVMVVWLPENDTTSHHEFRGQFGMARRTLSEADAAIGKMSDRLQQKGVLERTYMVLVSDHGHLGGRTEHLERFDIVNEFFHAPADIDGNNQRVGGGLGVTVRQDRYVNRTEGDGRDDFVFVDAVADGVARISLPKTSYGSGDWSGVNDIQTLFRYPVRGLAKPINLFNALNAIRVDTATAQDVAPVDLILARIDSNRVLISGNGRGYGVIEQSVGENGQRQYRYSVVARLRPQGRQQIVWDVVKEPAVDPLRLAGRVDCCLFDVWHDEETWLRITMGTLYPDSVVAMARHMLWKPELAGRAQEYGVDLVVTAQAGWLFNTRNEPGSAHGHPFQETMNNTFFVSGPGIRKGAIVAQPVRSIDLTPTILDMVGVNTAGLGFDGKPVRAIYQSARTEPHVTQMPLYWQDIDLGAWAPIAWDPRQEYPGQPKSVNQPMNFWDLSNLTYNAASIREVSVNRVFDDTSRFIMTRVLQQRSQEDRPLQELYRQQRQRLNDGPLDVPQLQLNKIALGDYSWRSAGNLSRAKNVAKWAWKKTRSFDKAVSAPFGGTSYLGTNLVTKTIDAADYSANELRRIGSREAVKFADRWILSGVEDTVDRVINSGQAEPATRRVKN
jgi:arylsulfatase A-like enzyme